MITQPSINNVKPTIVYVVYIYIYNMHIGNNNKKRRINLVSLYSPCSQYEREEAFIRAAVGGMPSWWLLNSRGKV